MTRPPRQFSRGRSLLYSAILVFLFFGALEVVLRVVGVRAAVRPRLILRAIDTDIDLPFMRPDTELFWAPRPGWRGAFQGRAVTINALGLRGPEVAVPKPRHRRRIACFGDSITFGYGVADDETYPARLGVLAATRGVDVVNAGVTGYTSYQVEALLRRLAPVIQPDVATFCVGWNDATLRPLDDRGYARRLRSAMAVQGFLDYIYIFRAARSLYVRAGLGGAGPARQHRVGPDRYRENLEAIAHECRQRGIRPVFVGLPRRKRPDEPEVASPYPGVLAQAARDLDVPLVLAEGLVAGTSRPDNAASFIDTLHLSPVGGQELAEAIASRLAALGLL